MDIPQPADGGNQQHVAFFGLDLKPTLAVGRRTDGCPLYDDRNSYKGLAALVKDRTLDDVVLLGGVSFRFVRRFAAMLCASTRNGWIT